jgi:hypothetical protein
MTQYSKFEGETKMLLWENKEPDQDRYSINENRLSYAWNWFSFHAGQRTTIFNFFLVAMGLILAAFAKCVEVNLLLAKTIAILGAIVSLIFLLLEIRNRELTHMGEDVLRRLESEFLFKDQILTKDYTDKQNDGVKAGFLIREGVETITFWKTLFHPIKNRRFVLRHRFLIPITQFLFLVVFILISIFVGSSMKDEKSQGAENLREETKTRQITTDAPAALELSLKNHTNRITLHTYSQFSQNTTPKSPSAAGLRQHQQLRPIGRTTQSILS